MESTKLRNKGPSKQTRPTLGGPVEDPKISTEPKCDLASVLLLASVRNADELSRPTQDTVPHELPRLLLILLPLVSSTKTIILRRDGWYIKLRHTSVEPR